jgi:CheY-like chemotaxis protein
MNGQREPPVEESPVDTGELIVFSHIPIVVVSADATESHIDRLLDAEAAAYLTKPFAFGDLLRTIDDLLAAVPVR